MQLRVGSVSVTNGSATVYGNYVAALTSVVGTFTPGEGITWGGGSSGAVVRHDTANQRLYFYRTLGVVPLATYTITDLAVTKSATIAALTSDSTPDFATELAGPGGPKLFATLGTGLVYSVLSSSTDYFTLTGPYGGATATEVLYTITRDFSLYFAWPVPAPSDIDLASLLARLFSLIDATIYGPTTVTPTMDANWTHGAASGVRYWKDADRTVHLAGFCLNATSPALPVRIFTLPVGHRPLYAMRFLIVTSGTLTGVLEINTLGEVRVLVGTVSASVYLDGITFRAEG